MTKKLYISDVVTEKEISMWQEGQRYLIRSGTGSGKSHFVKTVLYNYCKERGFKILLFSNRSILKEQNIIELGDEKSDVIKTINYQYMESGVFNNVHSLDYYYKDYKVICYDEVQYTHIDSQFSKTSDLILQTISNPPENKILLLLTATPQILLQYYDFPKENVYDIKTNYDYVTQLSFYTKEQTPEGIVQNMDNGNKCLFFGDAQQAWDLKNKFDDSSFVCSKNNHLYKAREIEDTIEEITNTQQFDARLLACTKVLDNGVNLLDRDLKIIVLDIMCPITLLQCIGRKRIIDENDTVKIFIKNQHKGHLNFNYMKVKDALKHLSDFENMELEDFIKKYRKKVIADVVQFDREINISKKQYLIFMKEFFEKTMEEKDGYKIEICRLLGKQFEEIKDGDIEVEKTDIREIMEKYSGIKMFKEEQEKFKLEFFNSVYAPKKTNFTHRAIRSINAVLLEDSLPYEINTRLDYTENRKKGKTVWIINKL